MKHCTVFIVNTVLSVECTMYIIQCIVYTVHHYVYTVQFTSRTLLLGHSPNSTRC